VYCDLLYSYKPVSCKADIENPRFFVYSREEMSNSWDQLVCGHNAFLKTHWEKIKKDGNTTNTHFCIDPVGHKDQFDKIF